MPEIEIELPPPEEPFDPEAARRARQEKWRAIREKTATDNASPAPESSSAVLPPPSSSNLSDVVPNSTNDTPLPTNGVATRTSFAYSLTGINTAYRPSLFIAWARGQF